MLFGLWVMEDGEEMLLFFYHLFICPLTQKKTLAAQLIEEIKSAGFLSPSDILK